MKNLTFLLFFVLGLNSPTLGSVESGDSIVPATSVKATTRLMFWLHSMGHFSFGGRIVTSNPAIDFTINYNREKWGLLVFKAFDLMDQRSHVNFTLAAINRSIRIKNLTFTPHAGFILEQSRSFADYGSDLAIILITTLKLSAHWRIEHSALLGNLVLKPEARDWVNRFRLIYSHSHFDYTISAWHNNKVFDSSKFFSLGLGVSYSRIKLSETWSLNAGFTGFIMPYSSNELTNPKKNGLIFTLTLVSGQSN